MKKTNGIALVVTLMIALLLFLAVITISSSMSLSGKRVTSNQKVSIEAQYAAESGLALAATQLQARGQEAADFINNVSDFKLPAGTKFLTIKGDIENFCGKKLTGVIPTPGHVICTADLDNLDWSDPSKAPFTILTDLNHIDSSKYPPGVTPYQYWRDHLGPQSENRTLKANGAVNTEYTVQYGFVPDRAEMLFDGAVRLYWKAMPTVSVGKLVKNTTDVGVRKIQQSFAGRLYFDLTPPSFARYMMFTNYQRAGKGANDPRVYFFGGTLFNGPVHTNDKFNFTGNPWFGDEVTSTGCEKEVLKNNNPIGCKEAHPGYYYWDTNNKTNVKITPPINPIPPAHAEPVFTKTPKWDENYIALPTSSENHYKAAKTGGIFIEDLDQDIGDIKHPHQVDIRAVTLSFDVVAGKKYQFVQVHGGRSNGTRTVDGHCVKKGGGGGGGHTDPDPGNGPPVQRPVPERDLLASAPNPGSQLVSGTIDSALRLASALLFSPAYADDDDEPPKTESACKADPTRWRWVDSYVTTKREYFYYSFRIDESGTVEINRNDGNGWVHYRDNFNGVIYVGRDGGGGKGKTSNFVLQGAGIAPPTTQVAHWKANSPRKWVHDPTSCQHTVTQEDGHYKCIEPSIADFSQLTVVGNKITLNRDIIYEDRPCTSAPERQPDGGVAEANCPNTSATNVLGVYSDRGSIMISQSAPKNLHIDGVLMSAKERVYYEHWNQKDPKGYLHLTGGIIQNWYGRFGRLDGSLNLRNGYGRKFVYDIRMKNGLTPPLFPKFDGSLPWNTSATYEEPTGGSGTGFWKPVKGN